MGPERDKEGDRRGLEKLPRRKEDKAPASKKRGLSMVIKLRNITLFSIREFFAESYQAPKREKLKD